MKASYSFMLLSTWFVLIETHLRAIMQNKQQDIDKKEVVK